MNLILFLYHDEEISETANALEIENSTDVIANAVINKKCEINIINQYKENHFLGNCKIDDIIEFNICKWEYNRPPDEIRVAEIYEYINKNGSIDWIIYCTYVSKIGEMSKIEIYDGMHRILAIKKYIDMYESTKNTRCPLRDYNILISIRINPTLGEIIDAFQNINKCVSIPDLYIDNSGIIEEYSNKKNIIEEITDDWVRRFKVHFKPSKRTTIPNINRDNFIDIIDKIYDHYTINSKNQLENILNDANLYIQNNILTIKCTEKALDKCKKTGCYLFIIKNILLYSYIVDHI